MELVDRVDLEVRELHRFFQDWFNAKLSRTDSEFGRVLRAWRPPFVLRAPSGEVLGAERLALELYSQFGAFPELSIVVKNLRVEPLNNGLAARALYEEWHVDVGETDCRYCEAWFEIDEQAPNGVRWARLQESRTVGPTNAL